MWLPCKTGAHFCLSACGTKEATLDAFAGPSRAGFLAQTSSASRRRNTRTPLAQSHGALQARKKSSSRRAGMVQALHTNPVLWARRAPQERHGNGTQCGRATEGDKKLSESEITHKIRRIMRCMAISIQNCPREGPKHPGICEGFRVLGLAKKHNHS